MKEKKKKRNNLEQLIYLIAWLVILMSPILEIWYNQEETANWQDVIRSWGLIVPFLVMFVIHNYILLPYFFLRKRYLLYILLLAITLGVSLISSPVRYSVWPDIFVRPFPEQQIRERQMAMQAERMREFEQNNQAQKPDTFSHFENYPAREHQPINPSFQRPFMHHKDPRPFVIRIFFANGPAIVFFIITILTIGLNIAIKLMFKSMRDERKLEELKRRTLQTELDNLKHQVNPHFFMNTLNNIHALIDIDTEKAKDAVIELSRMMRYVIYESTQETIPLKREVQFLENYVSLMRIRFTEKVDIKIDIPENIPDVNIPPLLLITFIENAFKHGISYQNDSFINFRIEIIEQELHCTLINSYFVNEIEYEHGFGISNVKKRLDLLYGDKYTLNMEHNEEQFQTSLIIPLSV